MADIIDLAGARVIAEEQSLDERAEAIAEELTQVYEKNNNHELRSVIVIGVKYDNNVITGVISDWSDIPIIVGALAIAQANIIGSMQAQTPVTGPDHE